MVDPASCINTGEQLKSRAKHPVSASRVHREECIYRRIHFSLCREISAAIRKKFEQLVAFRHGVTEIAELCRAILAGLLCKPVTGASLSGLDDGQGRTATAHVTCERVLGCKCATIHRGILVDTHHGVMGIYILQQEMS